MPSTDRIPFYIFGRNNPRVSRADGYYYDDVNDKPHLDTTSGAPDCIRGHTVHKRVVQILRSHAGVLNFATTAYFRNAAAGDRLIELMPDYAAVGFYQSGSDAVKPEIRWAPQINSTDSERRRSKIIAAAGTITDHPWAAWPRICERTLSKPSPALSTSKHRNSRAVPSA
jgi:adenosylmethionine-8-amino-7-oxononanoate aminotransferase